MLRLKALELRGVEVLSRAQMKNVLGGLLPGGGGSVPQLCKWTGTCPNFPGTQGDPTGAQAAADGWCAAAACCDDVDCPGAVS